MKFLVVRFCFSLSEVVYEIVRDCLDFYYFCWFFFENVILFIEGWFFIEF